MNESYEASCLFLPTRQLSPFGIRPLSGAVHFSMTLFGAAILFAHCGTPQAGLMDARAVGRLAEYIQIDSRRPGYRFYLRSSQHIAFVKL